MDVEPLPLFVFGTLRRGQRNHHRLEGTFVRMLPAILPGYGRLRPLMIAPRAGVAVDGELYFIRPDVWPVTIRRCDDLEGNALGKDSGPEYHRRRVRVETLEGEFDAWAYVASSSS